MDKKIIIKLEDFFSAYPTQEFKKGQIIMQADEIPSGIFYIEQGIIRRYWIFENGEEITLNLYKPHAFLPMSWAIGGVENSHIYEALTPVIAKKAPKEAVLQFLHKEPDVVYNLLQRVYIGMEGLWSHIESLTAGNSYTKLVASLVILAKRFGKTEEHGIVVQLSMNEQDIANYSGMSRETASRELQKLKKQGIVNFDRKIITVVSLEKLEKLLLL